MPLYCQKGKVNCSSKNYLINVKPPDFALHRRFCCCVASIFGWNQRKVPIFLILLFTWNDHCVESRIFPLLFLEFLNLAETNYVVLFAQRIWSKWFNAFPLSLDIVILVQLWFLLVLKHFRSLTRSTSLLVC